MQRLRLYILLVIIGLAAVAQGALAGAEPKVMSDEVLEMLSRGYKDLTQSKFEAAQAEYAKVIKKDFDNPYANNNMAVIMEKQGKLTDAMMYLNIGIKLADQYLNKVETAYLFGGVCAAVQALTGNRRKEPNCASNC